MAGVHQTAVKIHITAAAVFGFVLLVGGVEILVRGEATVEAPLTSIRQQGHDVTEAAVETRQEQGCTIICMRKKTKNSQFRHITIFRLQ